MTGNPARSDFRKLWIGQTISEFGSRITRDGLPLAAVITLGASPAQMGALSAVGAAAVWLVAMPAGVWVDRVRRKPILVAADIGRAALLGTIPLAAVFGRLTMEQLYVVTALAGVLTVLFDIAYQSFLPALVGRDEVFEGNRKLRFSNSLAEIAGPGLTGVLVQAVTAPVAILIDAISFCCSAVAVAWIRTPEPPPCERARHSVWSEAAGGATAIASNPLLRALAGRAATVSLFGGFFGPLYSLYAIRELGMSPLALGIAITCGGVGQLLGTWASGPARRRFGWGGSLVGAALIAAAGIALIPLARPPAAGATATLIVSQLLGDFGWAICAIGELSLRQIVTPDHLLGRVSAGMNLMEKGVFPFGALAAGFLGEAVGVRGTLAIGAAGFALSVGWLIAVWRRLPADPRP